MRILLVLLLALAARPALAQMSPDTVEALLRDRLEAGVETGPAPGLSIAAQLPGGDRVDTQAGLADPRTGASVDAQTRFLSGSTGKTIVALVAVQLAGEGRLDLDAPISTWLSDRPWWPRLRNRDTLTLAMLLNHSAGVPDYLEDLDFVLAGLTRGERGYTPDELVGFVAGDRADIEPGAGFSYSDTDYILVGLIIEAATGERFYDLAMDRIVTPLGLAATEPLQGRHFDGLATGHRRGWFGRRATARAGTLTHNLDHEWTGGGWVTTPADLATLFRALGDGGRFAAEGAIMRRRLNPFDETGTRGYGFGLYVRNNPDGSYRIAHGGDFGGYRSAALYDSGLDIALAVQGNAKAFEAPDFAFATIDALSAD
jgi:D-alanyl-D-alanine carboxypeptidase